jgi:hypothetical protein
MAYQVGPDIVIDDDKNIINIENANISGIVTATSFSGDGSNLTGISINRFLSIESRVGVVTVTAFVGILTVFGREEDTNVLV